MSGSDLQKTGGWVTSKNGAHTTRSEKIIIATLAKLKKERRLVALAHKGYLSGKTVIVDYNTRQLRIDKPQDWPGTESKIRIVFKDAEKLWNQFIVKVLSVTGETIRTGFPLELTRIQRRANYRVETPRGSLADFQHGEVFCEGLVVRDVSAEGVLVCSDRKLLLAPGDKLSGIALTFPGEEGIEKESYVNIREGTVRRVFQDEQKVNCFGIQFQLTPHEEAALLKYVRQRERELLRKGMT